MVASASHIPSMRDHWASQQSHSQVSDSVSSSSLSLLPLPPLCDLVQASVSRRQRPGFISHTDTGPDHHLVFVERLNETQSVYWTETSNLGFKIHQSDLCHQTETSLVLLRRPSNPWLGTQGFSVVNDRLDLAGGHWPREQEEEQPGLVPICRLSSTPARLLVCLVSSWLTPCFPGKLAISPAMWTLRSMWLPA